jgi:hypothetical protein
MRSQRRGATARARSLADSVIEREPGHVGGFQSLAEAFALLSDLAFADCDAEASEALFAQERAVRARIGVDTLDADRMDERAFYDEEDADIQGARKWRIKSLDVRRRRATAFPDDPDALFQLADGYLRFGRFEREWFDSGKCDWFKEALAIAEPLAKANPDNAKVAALLLDVREALGTPLDQ